MNEAKAFSRTSRRDEHSDDVDPDNEHANLKSESSGDDSMIV